MLQQQQHPGAKNPVTVCRQVIDFALKPNRLLVLEAGDSLNLIAERYGTTHRADVAGGEFGSGSAGADHHGRRRHAQATGDPLRHDGGLVVALQTGLRPLAPQ
ncbi:hypothetical protein KBY67_07320 [Synechococcus sp. RedBA-s]|nr:hypothetical protein [Synechococcus sp. RedBA-s]